MTETSPLASWLAAMMPVFGINQDKDLAAKLSVPQSTVHRWRRGARPTVQNLADLGRLFGTRLETLLVIGGHLDGEQPQISLDTDVARLTVRVIELDQENARLRKAVEGAAVALSAAYPPVNEPDFPQVTDIHASEGDEPCPDHGPKEPT